MVISRGTNAFNGVPGSWLYCIANTVGFPVTTPRQQRKHGTLGEGVVHIPLWRIEDLIFRALVKYSGVLALGTST